MGITTVDRFISLSLTHTHPSTSLVCVCVCVLPPPARSPAYLMLQLTAEVVTRAVRLSLNFFPGIIHTPLPTSIRCVCALQHLINGPSPAFTLLVHMAAYPACTVVVSLF